MRRAFWSGSLPGVAAALIALVALAEAVDLPLGSRHSTWLAALKLALGGYLLVTAVRKFRVVPSG